MNELKAYLLASSDQYKGEVDPAFLDLAKQFSRLQDARKDLGGAGLCVYFQGKKVVDIYVGKKSATEHWGQDTLSVCYSTGKGVLATLAHVLVSQGLLDYDTPVADYWPEFAQNEKSQITLAHLLSHQSGLFDIRHTVNEARDMADWNAMLDRIAQIKPRFAVEQDAAYQPLTFGWLVGGTLEKATGRQLSDLMAEYLFQPLEIENAYFGVPKEQLHRVARVFAQAQVSTDHAKNKVPQTAQKKASLFDRAVEWTGQNPQDFQDAMIPKGMKKFSFFSDEGLQATIPAANGVFSAGSLAKIYAMLAQKGQWQKQQFIQPEVFQRMSQIQYRKRDRIMPLPMHWRLGYHRVLTLGKQVPTGFGHMGFNGSGAWCDPARELSFAYTHNFATASITGDYRLWGLTQETLRCADGVLKGRKGWF
ncbi:serine hydrolase domain-containing protein [Acinetobacter sp. GXMZU3951]